MPDQIAVAQELVRMGYAHIRNMGSSLVFSEKEKTDFLRYWDNLVVDENFRQYTHRERRILRYQCDSEATSAQKLIASSIYKPTVTYDVPYRQGDNVLSYAEDGFIASPLLQGILKLDRQILQNCLRTRCYFAIDIHQFRVKAEGHASPTTSGIHQDGQEWIFMHYLQSHNTLPVVSEIYLSQRDNAPVFHTAMHRFLETLVVDDQRLYHRASDVHQLCSDTPAYRDLLLVTFRQTDPRQGEY